MIRASIASVLSTAVLCSAVGQAVGGGKGAEKTPILLTENDLDRVVGVENGDVIEVRLPSHVPFLWVLAEEQAVLRPVAGSTKPKGDAKPAQNPPLPKLGAGGVWVQRYEIATDRAVNIRPTWIYSRFGNLPMTKKRIEEGVIPPPPKIRPNLKPSDLREGMAFQFHLQAHP